LVVFIRVAFEGGLPMDLFSLLKQDHQEMRSLLQKLISKPDPKREGLRDLQEALADLIVNHSKMEENYLYSRMQQMEASRELISHSFEDHRLASQTLQKVQKQRIESDEWVMACQTLLQELESHIQEEETKLFPMVQSTLNKTEISQIYQKMLQFREESLLITPDIPLAPD
jgi:hemerythrin-like domain-containing protein